MTHPIFDAKTLPLHLDEVVALHRALATSIKDERDVQRWYHMSGAELPGLQPGTPEQVWLKALDNMHKARTLRRFCDRLL